MFALQSHGGAVWPAPPRPGIAKPCLRHDDHRGIRRPTIADAHPHEDFVGRLFRVLDEDVEIAAIVERAGVGELEFSLRLSPRAIARDQRLIRERGLRILVEHLHVRMRRRRVEIIVELLDVFAVVPLGTCQPKQPFLHDGIAAVPEADAKAKQLLVVTEASNAVLAPSVGPAACVVMWQIVPRGTVGAVVLPHRAPLPLAHVRPEATPLRGALTDFAHACVFGRRHRAHPNGPHREVSPAWSWRFAGAPSRVELRIIQGW